MPVLGSACPSMHPWQVTLKTFPLFLKMKSTSLTKSQVRAEVGASKRKCRFNAFFGIRLGLQSWNIKMVFSIITLGIKTNDEGFFIRLKSFSWLANNNVKIVRKILFLFRIYCLSPVINGQGKYCNCKLALC